MRASPASLSKLLVLTACALGTSTTLGAPEPNDVTTTARVMVRATEVREFDWAKSQARSRVVYISSGPRILSTRMIDNDLQTAFSFSESDKSPTVIVELAKSTELHRVSTVFKAEHAELNVYLLNEFPKDPLDLRFAKPDATAVSPPDEHGMASVDVSVSSARYVALRWTRKGSKEPFTVAEISAFSHAQADFISNADPHLADNAHIVTAFQIPAIPVVSP
jgi:hypothetical protein